MKILATVLSALCVMIAVSAPALADYPSKPVQFIVPWPPGGEEDVLTRLVAEEFQTMYGTPAAVVNKPGGGGGPFPGAIEVAKAEADGYTIGSFVIGVPVVGPEIGIAELNPNPFTPVGIFLTYPFVIVAKKDAPYDTIEEMAAYARDNDIVLGHFGPGLVPTLVTFKLEEELDFTFAADAAFDNVDCNTIASGDVDVANSVIGLIKPCLDELKVLASITHERISLLPDVPTIVESVPSLNIVLWNGLFVPNGTPDDVIEKIEKAAMRALESQAAKDYVKQNGAGLYWKSRSDSEAQIQSDVEIFQQIKE